MLRMWVPLPAAHEKPIVISLSYPVADNSSATCQLRLSCHHRITLFCDPGQLDFVNADFFFNMQATLTDKHIAHRGLRQPPVRGPKRADGDSLSSYPCSAVPLHGLLGQSWCNAVYAPSWLSYEGDVADYMVQSPFATRFAFTQWTAAAETPTNE